MGTFLTFHLVIVTTTTLNVSHIQLNLYIASISFIPQYVRACVWCSQNLRQNFPVAQSPCGMLNYIIAHECEWMKYMCGRTYILYSLYFVANMLAIIFLHMIQFIILVCSAYIERASEQKKERIKTTLCSRWLVRHSFNWQCKCKCTSFYFLFLTY